MKKSKAVTCFKVAEPLLFEKSQKGRQGTSLPSGCCEELANDIPEAYLRGPFEGFPEVSEPQAVRHFTRLSQFNFGVDTGTYPLGSCTMKYNPKINEAVARLMGFTSIHPYFPDSYSQGALQLMFELERYLAEIAGMSAVSLQPAAGAHGEFAGIRIIRAALEKRGQYRKKMLIPDTAHGTNPASCTLNGYESVELKSGPEGRLTAAAVAAVMDEDTAGIMITNPNTLGLFEQEIRDIADVVHAKGGYLYYDGANMNALMGIARPGDMGFDVLHMNLHKTFSTPHGGGGPGAGPVAVVKELEPFLPVPRITFDGKQYRLETDRPDSIGRVRAFFGNFLVLVRAYTYIREMGPSGLKLASQMAVLNANYALSRLKDTYFVPYPGRCMHECVVNDHFLKKSGVSNVDVAKGLIDRGFHPPTVSFPINVHGALMIEPTESETREDVDALVDALLEIAEIAETNPQELHDAPHITFVSRPDEALAARQLILTADMVTEP